MIQYITFFIPLVNGGDEQNRLNAFLRGHRILNVEKHVFRSGWGFCVEWMDGTPTSSDSGNWRKTPRVDYREVLEPKIFEKFARLREQRKKIAAEDGIPPFMILTDAQMAELTKIDKFPEIWDKYTQATSQVADSENHVAYSIDQNHRRHGR